jgi:hypothetical protein
MFQSIHGGKATEHEASEKSGEQQADEILAALHWARWDREIEACFDFPTLFENHRSTQSGC